MKNKKTLYIILIIVIIFCAISGIIYLSNNKKAENEISPEFSEGEFMNIPEKPDEDSEIENPNSIIFVEEETSQTISDTDIQKSDDTTDVSKSDREGLNAAVFVSKHSELILKNSSITTYGKGSSGVATIGAKASATINDVVINTSGERSKGLLATMKGQLYANNITINTTGYKSSAIATDFAGGTIEVKNSVVTTDNIDSAGIYCTGDIEVQDTQIETKQAEGACIDGTGNITLKNVDIKSYKKRGVIIYYTGPDMGQKTTGTFKMSGGSLSVKEGPAFYIMNTSAKIEIENVNINTESGIFLTASVDQFGELGQEGQPVESKGGTPEVIVRNQKITGDITIDKQSTLNLTLSQNSYFTGKIDNKNEGKEINIILEDDCLWTLTGDSYITSLNIIDESQINFNGYKIYYKN